MLARAAVRDADVLLLDEPFAGLDNEAREAVARAIRGISAGRTTIVVTHGDLEYLQPDLIVELSDGKLVAKDAGRRPEDEGTWGDPDQAMPRSILVR
jgi:ABC-type transport system involved in cytochrome bd biosynthesis fused ATPase/permease subunit